MGERLWYYSENEQQEGPIAEGKLRQMIASQIVHAHAIVWTDGMQDWLPASQVFTDLFQPAPAKGAPPPVPRKGQQSGAQQTYQQAPQPQQQQQYQQHQQSQYNQQPQYQQPQHSQQPQYQQHQQPQYNQQPQYQQQQYERDEYNQADSQAAYPNQYQQNRAPGKRMYSGGYDADPTQGGENKPAPWRRLFARSCDGCIYSLLTIPVLFVVGMFPALNELKGVPMHIYSFFLQLFTTFSWIPVEALLFQMFGTTPFKALFNVTVRNANGEKLSFGESASRSVELCIKSGYWVCLIPISLIIEYPNLSTPMLLAMGAVSMLCLMWQNVSYVKNGISAWDRNRNFVMTTPQNGAGRNILMIIVVIATLSAQSYISSLIPTPNTKMVDKATKQQTQP